MTDDILDNLFHWAALRAYLEVYAATKQLPPDSEATRRRAYELYEDALAEKNRHKHPAENGRTPPREAGQGCEAPEGAAIVERGEGELKITTRDIQSCREDDVSKPALTPASEPV